MLRLVLATLLTALVQLGDRQHGALQSRFVSPDVLATWSFDREDGKEALRILVLWRGSPGWAARAGGFGIRGTSVDSVDFVQQITVGSRILTVATDLRRSGAWIEGRVVDLRQSNVFLVDGIDTPQSPFLSSAGRIEPPSEVDDHIEALIRREPALTSFLRCDGVPENDVTGTLLCQRTLGR